MPYNIYKLHNNVSDDMIPVMYLRTKKVACTQNTVVQLVESYREKGKTKQRVVRHIGTANSPDKLEQLKWLAKTIKMEQEAQVKQAITKPIWANKIGILNQITKSEKIDLLHTEGSIHLALGIHDAYGIVYDTLGFSNLFSRPSQRVKTANILREIVFARIVSPSSKRASVELLNEQFGAQLKLDNVYQMMDKIDDLFCERAQRRALSAAINLTGEKINILFYDATTLYFESFIEDDLKQNGYSKDMKFNQPQILLALFVTEKGLPIGYDVFPGAMFEGHTLVPILEKLKANYNIEKVIFVADRGMLSEDNLRYLRRNNLNYIVGARLKSSKKILKQEILNWASGLKREVEEATYEITLDKNERLILSYRKSRAQKDRIDREKSIQKLQTRLKRSNNPKQLISNYGFQKFISVEGDARLQIDEDKLRNESIWDGIVGVTTNNFNLSHQAILEQYRGLWQIEESFRINKHDLRIRPVYHWTPKRIRAHIAIAFMAFTCVRHLEYRVATQYKKISPEKIKRSLLNVQASIIQDKQHDKQYLIPLATNTTAKQIYRILGIKLPSNIMRLANN
jgi:transposase